MHIYAQVLQPCAFSILVNLLLLSFMLHNGKLVKQIWHQALLTENHIADPAAGLPEVRRLFHPQESLKTTPAQKKPPRAISDTGDPSTNKQDSV